MILTIGITSYNRIKELERCIRSIDTKYTNDIEVLVSEDCSPLHLEIERMVFRLNDELDYNIRFCSNVKKWDMIDILEKKAHSRFAFCKVLIYSIWRACKNYV